MSRHRNSPEKTRERSVPFSVKLDQSLRDRLDERAKAEQRTASQHVRWLILRDSEEEAAA